MKTLYERYEEAREQRRLKYQERQESKSSRFDELHEQLLNEDLRLIKIGDQYVVTTPAGDEISERFDDLDEVETWLNDPEFVFND